MKYLFKFLKLSKCRPQLIFNFTKGVLLARIFKKRMLRGVDLAITYHCPAGCEKCSAKDLADPGRPELSIEEIEHIISQSVKMGAINVTLTGGEPVLRSDIVEIVRRISKKPIMISLATCGYTITDEQLKELKNSGLGVMQISLTSPFEQEHDMEVRLKGSYKKVLEVIKTARELGIEVLINTVVTHEKLHSDRIEKLINIAKVNKCFLCFIFPAEVGGWKGKNKALNQEDFALITQWLKNPFTTNDTETSYYNGFCPAGTEKIYISAYGDLHPCPLFHKKYGNVLEEDLAQLWQKMSIDMGKSQCEGCLNVINDKKIP